MTKTSNESPQPTADLVHTSAYFRVEPCVTCFIPGYLIVSPQLATARSRNWGAVRLFPWGQRSPQSHGQSKLSCTPERVYCALFAEETRSIHFHLFPRTAWLLSQYAAMHPADREISGPRLLDWARRTFHRPISTDYTETVEAIFREFDLAVSER